MEYIRHNLVTVRDPNGVAFQALDWKNVEVFIPVRIWKSFAMAIYADETQWPGYVLEEQRFVACMTNYSKRSQKAFSIQRFVPRSSFTVANPHRQTCNSTRTCRNDCLASLPVYDVQSGMYASLHPPPPCPVEMAITYVSQDVIMTYLYEPWTISETNGIRYKDIVLRSLVCQSDRRCIVHWTLTGRKILKMIGTLLDHTHI